MSFRVQADIVSLFKGLVTGLTPFASAQEVDLVFSATASKLCFYYNPSDIVPDFSKMLCCIITFTPQSYKVTVTLEAAENQESTLILSITNTGVNLSKVGEISNMFNGNLTVENLKEKGTRFTIEIAAQSHPEGLKNSNIGHFLPKQYPAYYKVINKRLTTHFANLGNLEVSAMNKSPKEGVFLKKINAIITSHLQDNTFNVDKLAAAVALSRTQLFRKIKYLTKMAPGRYILFFRLQRAKRLLQSRDKDLNVSDVCYAVGFVSKSHFSRSFQKQFGFNPSKCK